MTSRNRRPLAERIAEAAEAELTHSNSVSLVHVFLRIGWLDPNTARRWQQGQVDYLEQAIQTNPLRIREAMALLESWATAKGLIPSEVSHVARSPARQALRFSETGNPEVEQRYRTHWLARDVSEKERNRLVEKASKAPELVVIQPLNDDWKCHRCGGTGNLLIMEKEGPACLSCVGLGDLEYLPAGDALLTRRAKAKSARHAVVVRFSKSRKRYERQGLLVEPAALAQAEREVSTQDR